MLQTLLRIPMNLTVPLFGWNVPVFGVGILLVLWCVYTAWWVWRYRRIPRTIESQEKQQEYLKLHGTGKPLPKGDADTEFVSQLIFNGLIALAIVYLPRVLPVISIYGYGMALVCGFLAAAWLAGIRAQRQGIDPALVWDVGMVVLFSGVVGARLFYVAEHPAEFFGGGRNPIQVLVQLVNLPSGGLVLYGGVLLGIASYIGYCSWKGLSALKMADIVIPSIFVGEMFGRIGCFLNGCCYGAPTDLPWAVCFPPGSVPYAAEMELGLIARNAACSLPLHPAQIYSSLNAMTLAIITWHWFPHRSRDGSVLLLGWILYPITRFCLEMIRNDTPDYILFGIPLTIAQWVSIGMLIGAAFFAWFLAHRPKLDRQRLSPPFTPALNGANLQH